MIRPPGSDGVAFSERADGDIRSDSDARRRLSGSLGISPEWATVTQVHGAEVIRVDVPGLAGEGDGLWTRTRLLPLAVFTADCLGVVMTTSTAVGVAHAGWRGVDSGIVASLRDDMARSGEVPTKAYLGPGIGPCCFEVGPEVLGRFVGSSSETTWGTLSVDLVAALGEQLEGVEVWVSGSCTMHEDGWYSHRQDQTTARLASVGWVA